MRTLLTGSACQSCCATTHHIQVMRWAPSRSMCPVWRIIRRAFTTSQVSKPQQASWLNPCTSWRTIVLSKNLHHLCKGWWYTCSSEVESHRLGLELCMFLVSSSWCCLDLAGSFLQGVAIVDLARLPSLGQDCRLPSPQQLAPPLYLKLRASHTTFHHALKVFWAFRSPLYNTSSFPIKAGNTV